MAKEKPDTAKDVDDKAPEKVEPTPTPPAAPTTGDFTRCYMITHPLRANRVFADTPEEAFDVLCKKAYPNATVEEVKKSSTIRECAFIPAATEVNRPYGWPRAKRGKVTV